MEKEINSGNIIRFYEDCVAGVLDRKLNQVKRPPAYIVYNQELIERLLPDGFEEAVYDSGKEWFFFYP
jgi:hypothetical protein